MNILYKYLSFFFLFSCSTAPSVWHLSSLDTNTEGLVSKKLFYVPNHASDGIGLQFLSYDDTIHASFHIYQGKIKDKENVQLTIKIDEKSFCEITPVLKGNQQLVLSEHFTNLCIQALKDKKSIKVFFDEYEQTIDHKGFDALYPKFKESQISWTKFFKTEWIPKK